MLRRIVIVFALITVATLVLLWRYHKVAAAPRTVIVYFMVHDKASKTPISHAQIRVIGQSDSATALTNSDGTAILQTVLRPNWENSASVSIGADHYKDVKQPLISMAPQLGGSGDKKQEIETVIELERVQDVSVITEKAAMVCHFYGESNQGGSAWNKDEECVIPRAETLEPNFRQGDFICCGGGASSSTTNANIPAGLELRTSGGHYWAVVSPTLQGDHFRVHTYCGPEPAPGPGCNVDVRVIAHYR